MDDDYRGSPIGKPPFWGSTSDGSWIEPWETKLRFLGGSSEISRLNPFKELELKVTLRIPL